MPFSSRDVSKHILGDAKKRRLVGFLFDRHDGLLKSGYQGSSFDVPPSSRGEEGVLARRDEHAVRLGPDAQVLSCREDCLALGEALLQERIELVRRLKLGIEHGLLGIAWNADICPK